MKNNLRDLSLNAETANRVRTFLLERCHFETYRDVDTEKSGFWVKKTINGLHLALGIYVMPGRGISVNMNSMEEYRVLEGAPIIAAVIKVIETFVVPKYGKDWMK